MIHKKHKTNNQCFLIAAQKLRNLRKLWESLLDFATYGTSTRRQQSDIFGLRVKLPTVTTVEPFKDRGNPIKYLAQRHNKQTCQFIFTLPLLMLNVKQGSCEYKFLKSFGITRLGNPTHFYRLRGILLIYSEKANQCNINNLPKQIY